MHNRTNDAYHESFMELCNTALSFKGKDVIEVGGCELPQMLRKFYPKSWTAVDISKSRLAILDRHDIPDFYDFQKMNIAHTSFKDNSFDYIYSPNCFEHITDLKSAVNEMYRILRPGGILFAKFGPIWSSPIGHHTWVEYNNTLLHFNDNLFNDWFHLAYSREEFIQILQNQYSDDIVDKIAACVFDSKDINRLIDADYVIIFNESEFNTILTITSTPSQKF